MTSVCFNVECQIIDTWGTIFFILQIDYIPQKYYKVKVKVFHIFTLIILRLSNTIHQHTQVDVQQDKCTDIMSVHTIKSPCTNKWIYHSSLSRHVFEQSLPLNSRLLLICITLKFTAIIKFMIHSRSVYCLFSTLKGTLTVLLITKIIILLHQQLLSTKNQ